jgi:hypothetical protein
MAENIMNLREVVARHFQVLEARKPVADRGEFHYAGISRFFQDEHLESD